MSDSHNDETAIRSLIQTWANAACANDLDGVMAHYTPDVLAFDALGPLQHKGAEAYRKHWEMCISYMPPGGQMIMEPHEVKVTVGSDVAFAHYLARCGCVDDKGEKQMGWMRATVCCRKTANRWRIAHEHYSSPFDPETMKVTENVEP